MLLFRLRGCGLFLSVVVFLLWVIVEVLAWCVVVAAFVFVVAFTYCGVDGLAGVPIEVEGERIGIFTCRANVPG